MTKRTAVVRSVFHDVPREGRALSVARVGATVSVLAMLLGSVVVQAQSLTVTPAQKATAQQVAQAGVPLSELAPDAPARHTVQRGDTLWAISKLFLRSPWRWPELWGMNLNDIRNPHRIYPGQVLVLDTSSGRAVLKVGNGASDGEPMVIKVTPRSRFESLGEAAIPTIPLSEIEPFLAEAEIVDAEQFAQAPRIVAAPEDRVLLSRGDRAYARSLHGGQEGGLTVGPGDPRKFRIFRHAKPLKDPETGDILGYEAQYVGRALLMRGELLREVFNRDGKIGFEIEPATIDIGTVKEEVRVGDRLLPGESADYPVFVPHPPSEDVRGQIVSVYGNAVRYASQNQVVVINRGTRDNLEVGHVLMIAKDGRQLRDRTDRTGALIRLPVEKNGLMMVFRVFDKLAYALVMDITDGVKVGDRFVTPSVLADR